MVTVSKNASKIDLMPESQGSLCGKSAHQVQWWLILASATTTGLAVNGNHFG